MGTRHIRARTLTTVACLALAVLVLAGCRASSASWPVLESGLPALYYFGAST